MKAKHPAREVLDVNLPELEALLERLRQESLDAASYQKLQALLKAFRYLVEQIGDKDARISRLRALLMKPSTEKTSKVLEQAGIKVPPQNHLPPKAKGAPKPGHGRNGAQAYGGARRIKIAHGSLKSGDSCPGCLQGKVYLQKDPGLRIRVVGQAPIAATVYELERLRGNLCGEIFEAEAPAGVGEEKYDATARAMIALLRYGSGFPWNRLERLEGSLGIPLTRNMVTSLYVARRRS
jgi:transposase